MEFIFHDGGRAAAGYKGKTGDCVTRSIAIATERTYQEVYDSHITPKEDGQAAVPGCFARPIKPISNRSDGDGPRPCRLVLDARFTCGPQSFHAVL